MQNIDTDNDTHYITNHDNFNPHVTTDLNSTTDDRNDDPLVILAKQTTLTETQKSVQRKVLKNSYLATNTKPYIQISETLCIE